MAIKNISLSEDAYNILASLRQHEGESFSNVVRRMKKKVKLSDYFGILSKKSGEALEKSVEESRALHRKQHRNRIERLKKEFE